MMPCHAAVGLRLFIEEYQDKCRNERINRLEIRTHFGPQRVLDDIITPAQHSIHANALISADDVTSCAVASFSTTRNTLYYDNHLIIQ